jgi:hypothetical protein
MGQIVLAAKVTHVPSLLLSEREGTLKGRRALAIESLKEIGKRVRDRHADTFLISILIGSRILAFTSMLMSGTRAVTPATKLRT